jgi:hypothetical protein
MKVLCERRARATGAGGACGSVADDVTNPTYDSDEMTLIGRY